MGKFQVTTTPGGPSGAAIDAANKLARDQAQDTVLPELPTEQIAQQVPTTDPEILSLQEDGFDITVAPAEQVAAELGAGVEEGRTDPSLVQPQPSIEQEQQRERERIAPFSERATGYNAYAPNSDDKFHQQLDRAAVVQNQFQYDEANPVPVVGTYVTAPALETLQAGQDPYADQAGPVATLVRLGAGELDLAGRGVEVDPMFTTIGTVVLEKFFQGEEAWVGNEEVDFGTGQEELVIEGDDVTPVKTKAKGNERVGRTIAEEYLREKAVQEGQPSDTYLLEGPQLSREDYEFLGGMFKEVYAQAMGPDIIRRVPPQFPGDSVKFQPTALGLQKMTDADRDAGRPFDGREVPPALVPPTNIKGQLEYEGRTYTRPEVTKVGQQPEGKSLAVLNEMRRNFAAIPWKIDGRGENILIQNGSAAVGQAIQVYQNLQGLAEGELNAALAEITPELKQQQAFADLMDIGLDRLISINGELARLRKRLEKAELDLQTSDFGQDRIQAEIKDLQDRIANYNPLDIYRAEVNKFIESLNTITRYDNQVNHLTLSIQMLTGRAGIQQNKLNPQTNKLVRFALRVADTPVTIRPKSNSVQERNFKEVGAAMFLSKADGKFAFPETRLQNFDQQLNNPEGRLARLVPLGQELLAIHEGRVDDATLQPIRDISVRSRSQDNIISVPPSMQGAAAPAYSDAVMQELQAHDPEEIPYVIEYLMDLARYADGKPFSTTFEAEMDGITNGPSTVGTTLGLTDVMLRAGVLHDGNKTRKLQAAGEEKPADLRGVMGEHILNTVAMNADAKEGLAEVVAEAVDDTKVYLKKPPMTTVYGQELGSLKTHVQDTMYTGKNSTSIQALLSKHGLDHQQTEDYLHQVMIDGLTEALGSTAIQLTRQLRANNVLAALTGVPLYHDNAMGFRQFIAGKETTGQVGRTYLKVAGQDVSVPHYQEEVSGAARRPRGVDPDTGQPKFQIGGWGHGRVIPAVVQSHDATMIAKSLTGRSQEKFAQLAKSRGHNAGWLPIFDAGKANLGKLDLVRETMNREWFNGIEQHSFVEQIMGPGGWFEQASKQAAEELRALDPNTPIDITEGKYAGIYEFLDDKHTTQIVEKVYPSPILTYCVILRTVGKHPRRLLRRSASSLVLWSDLSLLVRLHLSNYYR